MTISIPSETPKPPITEAKLETIEKGFIDLFLNEKVEVKKID